MKNTKHLVWIDLNITDLCNLTCSFCPRSDPEVWPNQNIHMPLETIQKITDDLIEAKWKGFLSFTGRGESTLHEDFEKAFNILNRPDRTYRSHMTHNGVQTKKYWKYLKRLDDCTINTYSTVDQFEKNQQLYSKLDNTRSVTMHFKPDGQSFEELFTKYRFKPNNRSGMIVTDKNVYDETPCVHPIKNIFINYNGDYELCCNDWNYKTVLDNVNRKNILDIYMTNPRLNRAALKLLKGERTCEQACSECDSPWFHPGILKDVTNDPEAIYNMSMMALQDE